MPQHQQLDVGGAPGKSIGYSSRFNPGQRHAFVYLAIPRNPGNYSSGYGGGGRQEQECHRRQEPAHLSNHHRNTLRQLFQHPVSHNIEWRAVVSLLEAVGSIVEQHAGKFEVTLGSETEFFDPPAGKDIDVQMVVDLRGMLSRAGYGADAEEGGAKGKGA